MNFISEGESRKEQVELKYCERCGGLFLRGRGADGVYCAGCTARVTTEDWRDVIFPGDRRRLRPARLPKGPKADKDGAQGMARIETLRAVADAEVTSC